MPQLNFSIPDALLAKLDAAKPEYLDRKGFLCLLIDEALTGGAKLPAYRVGAGTSSSTATKAQPTNEATSETPVASKGLETSVHSTNVCLGDGVGREHEGDPRRGESWTPRKKQNHLPSISRTQVSSDRAIRPDLQPFTDLIRDFWRIKGGSKGDRAWALLQTELVKIKEKYGDAVVRQQIELAINGKWKGITEANYTRFLPKGPGGAPAQPETRHPASRVFTAKDFEYASTTNPALEGLF